MRLLQGITYPTRGGSPAKVVTTAQACSSVLPHGFNDLFALALNLREQGKATHFAMLHSDIVAPTGWLDALYNAMDEAGLDLVSAVVPIKGPTGRTSTAIGDATDPWRVKRCLYLADRSALPETFTASAVCAPGEVLLVNTAMMLLDLRRPWWDDFAFQFHTRIVRTTLPDGTVRREAGCRSEDWEMSHHLHRAGARYGATWAVKLRHEGLNLWPNHDEETAATAYWRSVDGWLTPEEGAALARLAGGRTVLEMGAYKGRSACCLAAVADRVVSLDHFRGDDRVGFGPTLDDFTRNVTASGASNVEVVVGEIARTAALMPASSFDLIYVDDAHDVSTTDHVREAIRLVRPGGTIAFHDWPIVAVQEAAAAAGLVPEGVVGSLAWCRVPGPGS